MFTSFHVHFDIFVGHVGDFLLEDDTLLLLGCGLLLNGQLVNASLSEGLSFKRPLDEVKYSVTIYTQFFLNGADEAQTF